jgi:hypothetical protein
MGVVIGVEKRHARHATPNNQPTHRRARYEYQPARALKPLNSHTTG